MHTECVFVASIHLSRTWMSGSFESMWWNACVHRLYLSLYSHPKEFRGNRIRTHVNSKVPKPQAPKPDQSPTASCSYQEGCSAVDSSLLWNIRKWASGHPCKGGFQRRTACQQCQLQWKEDSHQSTHNVKITEGWLPPAVPEAASHSGEDSHRT